MQLRVKLTYLHKTSYVNKLGTILFFSWKIIKLAHDAVLRLCVQHMSFMQIIDPLTKNNCSLHTEVLMWLDLPVLIFDPRLHTFNALCVTYLRIIMHQWLLCNDHLFVVSLPTLALHKNPRVSALANERLLKYFCPNS